MRIASPRNCLQARQRDDWSSRPLRVALINAADKGGGAEASAYSLHRALGRLGHDSRMFVGTKHTDDENVHEIGRYRCLPGVLRVAATLERQFGWQYLYHPWFRTLGDRLGDAIDVVHIHTLWSGRLGYADVEGVPRLARSYPTVVTLRDHWLLTGHCSCPALHCERWTSGCGNCPDLAIPPAVPHDGTRFNWERKRRAIQKSPIRVTAVSDWLAARVRQSPIFAGHDVHTIYNGVDVAHFYPRPKSEVRARLGLPAEAFIVMVAGQSVEGTYNRGGGAVDHALNALRFSRVTPHLLAVGRSARQVIERWAGAGTAVEYQDDPSALAEYYCSADVVLVASLWETFGRVAAEAQVCGIPVVAFATGGIPEVVADTVTGLIVERENADALGDALRRLHDDAALRHRMGVSAAKTANRRFANETIARRYIEHYRASIDQRRSVS